MTTSIVEPVQDDHYRHKVHYGRPSRDREWILDRLVRSANPIISLYAEMERQLGK